MRAIKIVLILLFIGVSAQAQKLILSDNFNATEQEGWQRNPYPLLTNFENMYNPCVVETAGTYPYKMWFFGWSTGVANPGTLGADAVFFARSQDLTIWEVYSGSNSWDTTMNPTNWVPVLHASTNWYEAWHVGDPSVVLKDGLYHMVYSATSPPFPNPIDGYPAQMVQCLMGATSVDGINWQKTEQPILMAAEDSANPSPNLNRIGDYHRPSLLWEDGKWKLWFDYQFPGHSSSVGYAENTTLFMSNSAFTVQHDLLQPLIDNWPNPEVIHIGSVYHSFSDPGGYPIDPGEDLWKSRQLREAISFDGFSWAKLPHIPPDADADACHVPQAFVTSIEGQQWLYLFYATQVGYKKNDGQYHFQYDRIRAMKRLINN